MQPLSQMAQVPVTLFNANIIGVQVCVNNGQAIPINGTNSNIFYLPQHPVVDPVFSNAGPAPGVLAPGDNSLNITPQGETQPRFFTLRIPRDVQIISLQIYIYWNTTRTVSWVALNNGQYLASFLE